MMLKKLTIAGVAFFLGLYDLIKEIVFSLVQIFFPVRAEMILF